MAVDFSKMTDACRSAFGRAVTYTTSSGSVSVTAVRSRCQVQLLSEDGVSLMHGTRTYRVAAADLVISEAAVSPARGHTITDGATVHDVMTWETDAAAESILLHVAERR